VDAVGWVVFAAIVAAAIALVALAPALHRSHRRRQQLGGGGSLAGVGSGLDAVWRPSADEARADWEAQAEAPAPAPIPGDKGRIEGGRIVIRAPRDDASV
jgi:hypothetical protein